MSEQVISLATVENKVDPNREGSFTATIDYLGGNVSSTIYYTSPYASNGPGAFVAIPEVGVRVLVCRPAAMEDEAHRWYYLGSTFLPIPNDAVGGDKIPDAQLNAMDRVDPTMYASRGVPLKMHFRSPNEAGLTISESYDPKAIEKYTQLTSSVKKKIVLHDSPDVDSIILDSGNNSRIILSSDPKKGTIPARAVQIESAGPQLYKNTGSQTDMFVGSGGRELQLINRATGIEWTPIPCGNVNIQSEWKDVNVFTQSITGRIFIQCVNKKGVQQVIQIETRGTGGNIIIKAGGDITLNALGGNLNIKADAAIKMKTSGRFSLDCASVDIKSTGVINMDGSQIHLANGAVPDPVIVPIIPNYYDIYNPTPKGGIRKP